MNTFYRVERGETLGDVARKLGVSCAELAACNHLNGVEEGQLVFLPERRRRNVIVLPFEKLSEVAARTGVSEEELRKLNGGLREIYPFMTLFLD